MKFIIIIFLSAILCGCGQYGALYLPGTKSVPKSLQHQTGDAAHISETIQQEKP